VLSKPELIVQLPPAALVIPCRNPYRDVATAGQVVSQLTETRAALGECSAKVDAIRKWRDGASVGTPNS